jgi:ribosome maturation factor RimP
VFHLVQAHEFPPFFVFPVAFISPPRVKLYANYVKIWLKFYIFLRKTEKPLQNKHKTSINPVNPKLILGVNPNIESKFKRVGSQKEPALLLRKNKNLETYIFKNVIKPPIIKKIERTITPTVESMGFELVRVILIGSGKPTLQIMAERPWDPHAKQGGGITIDECGKLSQAISVVLDVENTMEDTAYYLEVGSPGIDRPLTRLKDFERFAGQEARLEIDPAVDGRKRFKGTLKGLKGEQVLLATEEGEKIIPFSSIERAKLLVPEQVIQPKQPKKSNAKK